MADVSAATVEATAAQVAAPEATPAQPEAVQTEDTDPAALEQQEYLRNLDMRALDPAGVHAALTAIARHDAPQHARGRMAEAQETARQAPTKDKRREAGNEAEAWEAILPGFERTAEKALGNVEKMIKSEVPETKALGLELKWTMNRSDLVDSQRSIVHAEAQLRADLKTANPDITEEQVKHEIETNVELNGAKAKFAEMLKIDKDVSEQRAELRDSQNKEIPRKVEPLAIRMQQIANAMMETGNLTAEQIESVRNNPAGAIRQCLSITIGNPERAKVLVSTLVNNKHIDAKHQEELIRAFSGQDERLKKLLLTLSGITGLLTWIILGKSYGASSGGGGGKGG